MTAPAEPIVSGIVQRRASSGHAIPTTLLRKFEASLGTDLSTVRLHTGADSATAASAVGARAFAFGQDVHFAADQYDPSSRAGEHLIAHEVAHTVQQRGGAVRQNKLEVSEPHDPAELEADRAADAMVSGAPASIGSAALAIHRNAGPPVADPMGPAALTGPIYSSGLVSACPSLPRRTSNQVFFQLAKNFDAYDFTKKHFDSELAKLGPLLGYHPDLTKAIAAAKAAAQPGGALRGDGRSLNDRRVRLSEIAEALTRTYGTMNRDANTYREKSKILDAQKQLLNQRLVDLKDKDVAEAQRKALDSNVLTMLNDVFSWTGMLLGLGNVVASEAFKMGTAAAFGNKIAADDAMADMAGQASQSLLGFVVAAIEKTTGVTKDRDFLNTRIAKLQQQLVHDQVAFDFVTILNTMVDLAALEATIKAGLDAMQKDAGNYDTQRAAVRQAEGDRDASLDKETHGKLTEIQNHITDCTNIDSAAGALIGGSMLAPLSPPTAPALQASLQAASALAGAAAPKQADPFTPADDPVPAALANETHGVSNQIDVTMGQARDAQQHAQDKRTELTALADSLRAAANVPDPRLP